MKHLKKPFTTTVEADGINYLEEFTSEEEYETMMYEEECIARDD